jgi:hypothetical protein
MGDRGDSTKPGGRLWLLKWLMVVALLVLMLVILFPGSGIA